MTKVFLLILDGLSDKPSDELAGQTPLEAAYTPHLDTLAAQGINGLLDPIGPGIPLRSETSHFILFGYPLEDFPGRALCEARYSADLTFNDGDVLCSTNFASVIREEDYFKVVEREIKLNEEEMIDLSKEIAEYEEGHISIQYTYIGQTSKVNRGYGIIKVSGEEVSDQITDSDPFYNNMPVIEIEPIEKNMEMEKARITSRALNSYLRWVYGKLSEHSINLKRKSRGLAPVNFLLTLWASRRTPIEPFHDRYGMKAISIIGDHPVLNGLARELGMDDEEFHCLKKKEEIEKHYRTLFEKLNEYLEAYDFIHINARDPDLAAHTKSPTRKKEVLEAIDNALEVLIEKIIPHQELLVTITGDHGAPSVGDLLHCGESVPILMVGKRILTDGVKQFNERAAVHGGLGRIFGKDYMNIVLNFTERINMYGLRLTPRISPTCPGKMKRLTCRV
jgi:2,3-bisphosphoglycerate-independent phosphoglycerate mutase